MTTVTIKGANGLRFVSAAAISLPFETTMFDILRLKMLCDHEDDETLTLRCKERHPCQAEMTCL